MLLGDGTYTARAELSATAFSSTNTFVVDRSVPTTQITNPETLTNAKPTFTLTSSEPDTWPFEPPPRFECALDGGDFVPCDNPARFNDVSEGPHTFRTRSVDAAGNRDPLGDSINFTTDASIPTTTVTTPAPGLLSTGAYIAFQSSEVGSRFRCQFDSGAIRTCTSPHVIPSLKPGRHAFNVRAVDGVGNIDPNGVTLRWETAPILKTLILSPRSFVPVAPKRKGGGTMASYSFSGRARLRLLFEQVGDGLLDTSTQRCVYASKRKLAAAKASGSAQPCVRYLRRGGTATPYGDTRTKKLRLTGRLLGKPLPAGIYRVTATPVDAGNRAGRPRVRIIGIKAIPKPKPKPKPRKKTTRKRR